MIPESFIQDLLNRTDIVDVIDGAVPLKKAGANYAACCPFHNEKSPSFTVSPTKQFYHCFGCGAHGTAISFVMEYQGIGFVEAVEDLSRRVGLVVPQQDRSVDVPSQKLSLGIQESLQRALEFYKQQLKASPIAIDYLKQRGLTGIIAARFQIGYAPAGWQPLAQVFEDYPPESLIAGGMVTSNDAGRQYDRFRDRIMFPIHDQRGQVIGFGGRVLGKHSDETGPKYLNSPETVLFQKGLELYGLFLARRAIRQAGRVLVVEGYMDVVALAQNGVEYAVATLGTATTPTHITKLMRQTDEIVFCFDGDAAGRKAAWRAAMNSLPALTDNLRLRFLFLPAEHDPDTYIREYGKAGFEAAMDGAMPLSQYIVNTLCADNDLQSQEDKVRLLNDAEPILKEIKAPRTAMMMRKKLAELTGISTAELEQNLDLRPTKAARKRFAPRMNRKPPTLVRRLMQMLLYRPELGAQLDPRLIQGDGDEENVLRRLQSLTSTPPYPSPAGLLEAVRNDIPVPLMNELLAELLELEESFAVEDEFVGALKQLQGNRQGLDLVTVLKMAQEHGLQALTAEQRAVVQQFRKPSAGN